MGDPADTLEPRIYVACLAAYNNGILHGAWIEVGDDADAVREEIAAMLEASPIPAAEEYAIHDFEDFGGVEIGEYAGIARVVEIAAFLRERGALGALVLAHFGGDLEEAAPALEDGYRGVFERLSDYLQELTEETVTIPESLRFYIDYEAMARDAEINGDLFTIEAARMCSGGAERAAMTSGRALARPEDDEGRVRARRPLGAPRRSIAGSTGAASHHKDNQHRHARKLEAHGFLGGLRRQVRHDLDG